MSVLSQCHSIIINRGISAHVHGTEVVDGLNAIDKRYVYQLISTFKIPGLRIFDSQIIMHSCTPTNDVSMAKEFQKNLSKEHHKHGGFDQGKYRKQAIKI